MKCEHTLTDFQGGGHRCFCCGRLRSSSTFPCRDCASPPVELAGHVDFTRSVEPASTGTCLFCSRTDAEFRFKGDDSVRICKGCVKS